jgi:hypothetical protein
VLSGDWSSFSNSVRRTDFLTARVILNRLRERQRLLESNCRKFSFDAWLPGGFRGLLLWWHMLSPHFTSTSDGTLEHDRGLTNPKFKAGPAQAISGGESSEALAQRSSADALVKKPFDCAGFWCGAHTCVSNSDSRVITPARSAQNEFATIGIATVVAIAKR